MNIWDQALFNIVQDYIFFNILDDHLIVYIYETTDTYSKSDINESVLVL